MTRADGRVTSEDLKSLGIDPSTARRQFLAHRGTSFAAYQRSKRLGQGVTELRRGRSTGFAGTSAGFRSDRAFRDAIERTFDLPASRVAGAEVLTSRWIATPLGNMLAVAHDRGIALLDFADRATLERSLAKLRARFASEGKAAIIIPGEHKHLATLDRELTEYFASRRETFAVPLLPAGTEFEQRALAYLRSIPFGQTRSYGQQATAMGDAKAVRPWAARTGGTRSTSSSPVIA
jgi:AraC family transcriptional regulator of adaptative response/methylated-DNA-[protein]-cysteine methyltransferase